MKAKNKTPVNRKHITYLIDLKMVSEENLI